MGSLHWTALGDVLRQHRRSWPAQTACVCGTSRYSYPELDDRVTRLAEALRSRGVRGDRILWVGQNCHRLMEVLLAAAKLGGVLCPVNWRQSAEELAFVISDYKPRVVFWQNEEIGDTARRARELTQQAAVDTLWLQHDGTGAGDYESAIAASSAHDPELDVNPAAPVLCMYTAAFDGKPRGAQLSHTALLTQALVSMSFRGIDSSYVYLNSGPLFHMATFMFTAATFLAAGTNVFASHAAPEEIARLVHTEKCTGAFLMGQTIEKLVELNKDGKYDLRSLRAYAASPEWNKMVTLDSSAAGKAPGGYGQTEVTGLLTLGALGKRPIPLAQLRIVDDDGREKPSGEVGEVVARGPTVMSGYVGRPQTEPGHWHKTGDLGRREADGSISFIGPKARLIKSAAENIYPAEVEACLREHPTVADCAVIGVPDAAWGQSVKAIVVVRKGQVASADDLVEHCRARIASYKKPRTFEFVDRLPRQGHAVDYAELDRMFGGGGYPGTVA
jgi:acyl-CoA synthetase (AMP-forming)/AMP-acid ligase II